MKQKLDDTSPVTKKELTGILHDYPTKEDLKKELSNYPTKEDLKNVENNLKKELKDSEERVEDRLDKNFTKRLLDSQNAFRLELQHQFLMQDKRWERRFTDFESRLITLIDPLLKDLETRNQERALAAAQMTTVQGDISNLDKRVTKLENTH